MTTPTLSKSLQRKSLSGKKGPARGLKNVLAHPHDHHWPFLKNDHGAVLENLLKRLFPVLKLQKPKISWPALCNLSTKQRSIARKAAQAELEDCDTAIRKSITFGINEATKLLEKNDACCVILDATIEPSLLVKHIVVMAQNQNVPILLVSFLKKVTLETVGFASAAIALKKHVKESAESYFYTLFEKVSELKSKIPIHKASISLFQDKMGINDKSSDNQMDVQSIEKESGKIVKSCNPSTDVYLYRTSKKERVFLPSNAVKVELKSENAWSDFIALDNDKNVVDNKRMPARFFKSVKPDNDNLNSNSEKILYKTIKGVIGESDKVSYSPLKVKRLQGNESRTKASKSPKKKK